MKRRIASAEMIIAQSKSGTHLTQARFLWLLEMGKRWASSVSWANATRPTCSSAPLACSCRVKMDLAALSSARSRTCLRARPACWRGESLATDARVSEKTSHGLWRENTNILSDSCDVMARRHVPLTAVDEWWSPQERWEENQPVTACHSILLKRSDVSNPAALCVDGR